MITIDYRSHKTIHEQIIDQIKYNALKGYLKPGDDIPSVRKLAANIGVTPNTVAKAYTELERQHIIETIRGKGTFIAHDLKLQPDEVGLEKARINLTSDLMQLKLMGMDKDQALKMIGEIYDSLE